MSRSKKVKKTVAATVQKSPLVSEPGELAELLPRPHRPAPLSELNWPRRLRRGLGALLFVSALAMGLSAATASSDWNVRSDDTDPG